MLQFRAIDWVCQIKQAGHDKVSVWIPGVKQVQIYNPKQIKVSTWINIPDQVYDEDYYVSNDLHYIIFKTVDSFIIVDVRLNNVVLIYEKVKFYKEKSTPFLYQEFDKFTHEIVKNCNYSGFFNLENKQQVQYWCLQDSTIIYNKQRNLYIFERPNTLKNTIFIREGDVKFNYFKQNQYFMKQNPKVSHFIRLNNYQKRIRTYWVPSAKFQIQISSKYILITQIQLEIFYQNHLNEDFMIVNVKNMRLIKLNNIIQGSYISITQDSKYIIYSNKDIIRQIGL